MAFSVKYTYKLIDKFLRPIKGINKGVDDNKKKVKGATKQVSLFSKAYQKSRKSLTDFYSSIGGATLGIAGMGLFLVGSIKSASNFADAMSDVDKVMDLTQKGTFSKFRKTILSLSGPLATMPEDLAKMAYQGAKVGVAEKDMKRFLTVVTKTKSAFDMTAEAAGSTIGDIKAKLNISISDTEKLLSRINYMADTTSASGTRMLDIIARVSGDFALMKFNTSEIAAFSAAADQIETSAELAASGLRMSFNKLQQSPIYRAKFQKMPVETFLSVLDSLKKMEPVARNIKIKRIFGDEAGKFIKKAVVNVHKFRGALKKASTDRALGSMDREFQAFLKRSSTGFLQLKIKFTKIFIKIGDVFLKFFEKHKKTINKVVDSVSEWIEKNEELIPVVLAIVAGITLVLGVVIVLGAAIAAVTAIVGVLSLVSLPILGAFLLIFAVIGLAVYGVYKGIQEIINMDYSSLDGLIDKAKKLRFIVDPFGAAGDYIGGEVGGMMGLGDGNVTNSYKTEMIKKNDLSVNGDIRVSADKGSNVSKKNININQGQNVAMNY